MEDRVRMLLQNSEWATLILGMVTIRVRFENGTGFHAYLMPWECLDKARMFEEMGAKSMALFPGNSGPCYFTWSRARCTEKAA